MTSLRTTALVLGGLAGVAAGWACGIAGCDLIACSGGFRYDLRIDAPDTDDITLEIEAENGRSTWTCSPTGSRCARESSLDGDREFDVIMTMAGATVPFAGLPCDATACIRIEIRGTSDDSDDQGTYGPEMVTVRIIDEDGEEFARDFAPEYDRTENYGGEDCGYCDSLETFDERTNID